MAYSSQSPAFLRSKTNTLLHWYGKFSVKLCVFSDLREKLWPRTERIWGQEAADYSWDPWTGADARVALSHVPTWQLWEGWTVQHVDHERQTVGISSVTIIIMIKPVAICLALGPEVCVSQVSTVNKFQRITHGLDKGVCFICAPLYCCVIDSPFFHLNEQIKKDILSHWSKTGKPVPLVINVRWRNARTTSYMCKIEKVHLCATPIISSIKAVCTTPHLRKPRSVFLSITHFHSLGRLNILTPFYRCRDQESLSKLPKILCCFSRSKAPDLSTVNPGIG